MVSPRKSGWKPGAGGPKGGPKAPESGKGQSGNGQTREQRDRRDTVVDAVVVGHGMVYPLVMSTVCY